MSEIVAFSNKSVILTTDKGSYRVYLPDVVSVEIPFETGIIRTEAAFTVRLVNGGQQVLYATSIEGATITRELLLSYWDSFTRHHGVYENSGESPKTTLIKGNRLQVSWGGNTVVVTLNNLEGIKLDAKSVRVIYPEHTTIFSSDNPSFLSLLKSGIESYLWSVDFD